ncbi:MAG: hypothetical protein F6K32_18795 [Desertifilum sp. SIO1I2]|nr:hypothetical protein [Desertifilum sp. SIO1I2]
MGTYDPFFDSEETLSIALSPEEAVGAIALITASALIPDESEFNTDFLANLLWECEILGDYPEEDIADFLTKISALAEAEGLGAVFNAAYEALSDEDVLDAFEAAILVIVLEREDISTEAKAFLNELQLALEIADNEAQEIIEDVLESLEETTLDEEAIAEIYKSPAGNFQVAVPIDAQDGGKINAQPGMVGFSDDFGTLLRIDYSQAKDAELEAQKVLELGQEKYLKSLMDSYISQAILTSIPHSQVLYEEYLDEMLDGCYFAMIDLPEGSTLSVSRNNEPPVRLNAYRGIIALTQDDYAYFITSQRSFFDGEEPGELEEEAEDLKDELSDFIETIEFIPA